jgi:hypothetical protein
MAFIKFKPLTSRFNFHAVLKQEEIKEELSRYITSGEKIFSAYHAIRSYCIFTDKRIILVTDKGIKNIRKSIFSIKYGTISSYALNVHFIDSSIEFTIESGYKISINFRKPIPLDEMFKAYHHITDAVINK